MATGTYAPDPFEQYCDDDGNPLSSGSLTVYSAGTSTPVNTYSDVNLTTPNTNPISLDAAGRPTSGAIFLTPGVSYKFILMDSLGATVATRDNIAAVPVNPDVTGTWTPVIGGSTSQSGQTYSVQTGSYTKIGTLVVASYSITLVAKGSIVGFVQIKGFPFTSGLGGNGVVSFWAGSTTSYVGLSVLMLGSATVAFIEGTSAAATTNETPLQTADISDTFSLIGTLIYSAAS